MWRPGPLVYRSSSLVAATIALSIADSFAPSLLWVLLWFASALLWAAFVLLASSGSNTGNLPYGRLLRVLLAVLVIPVSFALFHAVGDYVHLIANYRQYKQVVAGRPEGVHRFSWGGRGFAGSYQVSRILVYAPTVPPRFDAADWKSQVGGPPPRSDVKHLIGKYYVVEISQV